MPSLRGMVFVAGAVALAFAVTNPVSPQPLNRLPPAQAPCSVLSGHPCHPAFCSVFHRGPCFPGIYAAARRGFANDHRLHRLERARRASLAAMLAQEPATLRRTECAGSIRSGRGVRRVARLLGAAAEGQGAPRHGIYRALCLQARWRTHCPAAAGPIRATMRPWTFAISMARPWMRRLSAARRCISARGWAGRSPATRSPFASSTIVRSTAPRRGNECQRAFPSWAAAA